MIRRPFALLIAVLAGAAQAQDSAQAQLIGAAGRLQLEETVDASGALDKHFLRDGQTLYRSRTVMRKDGGLVQVQEGHASQLGRVEWRAGRLSVFDAQGRPLWSQALPAPLCLPELFPEFIGAHWAQLQPGGAPLRCVTPIIKAKKLAPVQFQRLPDGADGSRIVELQPGSVGMRLFLSPTQLAFSADGKRLQNQRGQFEAPARRDGRASYLKGEATYTRSREAQAVSAALFAPPASP